MSASSRILLCSLIALSWLAAGCSSAKKIEPGDACLLNSDCNPPLTCSFGSCHTTCVETRDCPLGQSCVKTPQGGVCQLPVEADCRAASCGDGQVCAIDYRCRTKCLTGATDCTGGQVCVGGVCADPSEIDQTTGQLPVKNLAWFDGGVEAAGSDGGRSDVTTLGSDGTGAGGAGGSLDGSDTGATGTGGTGQTDGAAGDHVDGAAGAGGNPATDGSTADASAERTVDSAAMRDVLVGPDAPATPLLDSGGSVASTGCGVVTTKRYFCDDFEGGLDLWEAGGSWNLTTVDSRSPSHSMTDSPDGNFTAGAFSSFILRQPIDLTAATAPLLQFWHVVKLCNYQGGAGDSWAYVEASVDGGFAWTELTRWDSVVQASWSVVRLDLASYAGKRLFLRFVLSGNGACVADGWYIDDMEVRELY